MFTADDAPLAEWDRTNGRTTEHADQLFTEIPIKPVDNPEPKRFTAVLTSDRGETVIGTAFEPVDSPYSVSYDAAESFITFWQVDPTSGTAWSERLRFLPNRDRPLALVYRVFLFLHARRGFTMPRSLTGGIALCARATLDNEWIDVPPPTLQAANLSQATNTDGTLLPVYAFDVPSGLDLSGASEDPPTRLVLTVDKLRKVASG